jgi:hypothetical protein
MTLVFAFWFVESGRVFGLGYIDGTYDACMAAAKPAASQASKP